MAPASPPPALPPLVGIAGWKNSGKTTLVARLVAEMTRRGYRVATVKHSHHELSIDVGETDTARHRRAGAVETALVGPDRWAIVHEVSGVQAPCLADIVARLSPADLVVVEGYKSAPIAKIETRRKAQLDHVPLAPEDALVIAIAADHAVAADTNPRGVPVFHLDDRVRIADLIERATGLSGLARAAPPSEKDDGS